jgi:hypothetical protein
MLVFIWRFLGWTVRITVALFGVGMLLGLGWLGAFAIFLNYKVIGPAIASGIGILVLFILILGIYSYFACFAKIAGLILERLRVVEANIAETASAAPDAA